MVDGYFEDAFLDPPDNTMPNPDYSTAWDRTLVGPDPWDLGAPDGMIRSFDIGRIVDQFFMDCP